MQILIEQSEFKAKVWVHWEYLHSLPLSLWQHYYKKRDNTIVGDIVNFLIIFGNSYFLPSQIFTDSCIADISSPFVRDIVNFVHCGLNRAYSWALLAQNNCSGRGVHMKHLVVINISFVRETHTRWRSLKSTDFLLT